jgi:beta-glucosidase
MDIDELLTKLTIKEKIDLLSGDGMWHLKHYDKLGLPKFMMTDGPHGLRKPKNEDPMGIAESFFCNLLSNGLSFSLFF